MTEYLSDFDNLDEATTLRDFLKQDLCFLFQKMSLSLGISSVMHSETNTSRRRPIKSVSTARKLRWI